MDISVIATLLKRLGAISLVLVIVWHLVHDSSPQRGKAIVRIARSDDMVVSIDQMEYLVTSAMGDSVVCELEPGAHVARVWHRGILLGEETFNVEAGKNVVVEPLPPRGPRTEVAIDHPVPLAPPIHPSGLAVRIRRPASVAVPN